MSRNVSPKGETEKVSARSPVHAPLQPDSSRDSALPNLLTVSEVAGDGPFVIRLEGRLAAAGENFDVYVWNFTRADWSLWLGAPFLTTDQTFERALAADEMSGLGEVRVLVVDATTTGDREASGLMIDLLEVFDAP